MSVADAPLTPPAAAKAAASLGSRRARARHARRRVQWCVQAREGSMPAAEAKRDWLTVEGGVTWPG